MLGFSPIGGAPIGGQSGIVFPLSATVGPFALTGKAASFALKMPEGVAVFSESGLTDFFGVFEPVTTGAVALAGKTLSFESFMAEATTPFHLMGWAEPLLAAPGAFSWLGNSVTFIADLDAAVQIGMTGEPGEYAFTGYAVTMQAQMAAARGSFCWHLLRQWSTDPDPTVPANTWAPAGAVAGTWTPASVAGRTWTAAAVLAGAWAPAAEVIDTWSRSC